MIEDAEMWHLSLFAAVSSALSKVEYMPLVEPGAAFTPNPILKAFLLMGIISSVLFLLVATLQNSASIIHGVATRSAPSPWKIWASSVSW